MRSARLRASFVAAALALASSPLTATRAYAQDARDASEGPASAEGHAQKGDQFYHDGNYTAAIAEYEQALKLDPAAKILVRNLGIVHEKAGDIDLALKYYRDYGRMDLTDEEREKNGRDVRRLEGAKKAFDEKAAHERAAQQSQEPDPNQNRPAQPAERAPAYGRIDALTITAAATAGAGLVWGALWGIKASADKPASGFVTGKDGTFADLSDATSKAHREAVFADVGFGVAILGGVSATLLYLLRMKDPAPATQSTDKPVVSAVSLPGGGALVVRGTF